MFETILHWAVDLYSDILTTLTVGLAVAQADAPALVPGGRFGELAPVLIFLAMPAVATIGFVHSNRQRFSARYGMSAARGWAWTITAFALGWVGVVYASMMAEAAKGAWTSATITPFFVWLIGLGAMVAITYGTLGAHWVVQRVSSED